jgi:hypothetical protein
MDYHRAERPDREAWQRSGQGGVRRHLRVDTPAGIEAECCGAIETLVSKKSHLGRPWALLKLGIELDKN